MSGETNCKEPSASSSPVSVVLTAEDIPGAALREPCVALFHCSIHQAIRDNAPIVDVDGSYLYKKSKRIEDSGQIVALLDSPSAPITGWEIVTEVNANIIAKKIPRITNGTIYTYLSAHASQGSDCTGSEGVLLPSPHSLGPTSLRVTELLKLTPGD